MHTAKPCRWRMMRAGVVLACCAAAGCSSPAGPSGLDFEASVPLEGGSTLAYRDGGALAAQRERIEQVVKATLAAVRPLLPVDGVTIVVEGASSLVIPELGIGGRADAATVRVAFDRSSPALADSLDGELFPLLAHELHHVARARTVGYGSHLLGAMVSEGLADQFSVEVASIDPPPWSSALSAQELAHWSGRAREQWFDADYNHGDWFFGRSPVIPRWAGYSIGFDLTARFLEVNPGRLASDLFAEPAASFAAGAP